MGDEQFQTIKKLCELIQGVDPEIATYAVERFMTEYYIGDETLNMSLSCAKRTLAELTSDVDVSAIDIELGDFITQCSACHRKSGKELDGFQCNMMQPNGDTCTGIFKQI